MSTAVPPNGPEDATSDAERRRTLAEVFEDSLPDGTQDERAEGWGERDDGDARDEWLRGEVPPHHG